MMASRDQSIAAMRASLLAGANAGGGWPYYARHSSRLEPTCWALLALGSDESVQTEFASHRGFLIDAQRADGLLLEPSMRAENRPNFGFNGLAVLLLHAHPDFVPPSVSSAVVSGLVSAKGIQIDKSEINRQDNSLQGWSWIDGSFSWVEPTAWCMIGLKKVPAPTSLLRGRLDEARKLLIDRCCTAGGWNYGNSNMLGQDLRPYVPTTALGLLAMQDRRGEPCVQRSLAFLEHHALAEQSAMALSLTLICLRVFGARADVVGDHLLAQWEKTGFLGNYHLTAMALYGLTEGSSGGGAFHV
jgi:hypothetical protein